MKAKLIVVGGTTSDTEMDLELPTIIGRGRSADVTIPHSLVSRQHCEISERDGRLVVRDLKSMNGTYVGDERVTETILDPDSLLTVGTVTFRAIYEVGNSEPSQSSQPTLNRVDVGSPNRLATPDAETVPVESAIPASRPLAPVPPSHYLASGAQNAEPDTAHLIDVGGQSPLESAAQSSD